MAAPLVAPDASVILKWVLPPASEPDFERALALRDAIAAGHVHSAGALPRHLPGCPGRSNRGWGDILLFRA